MATRDAAEQVSGAHDQIAWIRCIRRHGTPGWAGSAVGGTEVGHRPGSRRSCRRGCPTGCGRASMARCGCRRGSGSLDPRGAGVVNDVRSRSSLRLGFPTCRRVWRRGPRSADAGGGVEPGHWVGRPRVRGAAVVVPAHQVVTAQHVEQPPVGIDDRRSVHVSDSCQHLRKRRRVVRFDAQRIVGQTAAGVHLVDSLARPPSSAVAVPKRPGRVRQAVARETAHSFRRDSFCSSHRPVPQCRSGSNKAGRHSARVTLSAQ